MFSPPPFLDHLYFFQSHKMLDYAFPTLYPSQLCSRMAQCLYPQISQCRYFALRKAVDYRRTLCPFLGGQEQLLMIGISKRHFVFVYSVMPASMISMHMHWQMLGWLQRWWSYKEVGIFQCLTVGKCMFNNGEGMKIQWLGRGDVCRYQG